jgi:hypothetical protein
MSSGDHTVLLTVALLLDRGYHLGVLQRLVSIICLDCSRYVNIDRFGIAGIGERIVRSKVNMCRGLGSILKRFQPGVL